MGKASGVSSFFCDVLYLLCRRTFLSFRFRTFLSSHSKQGLTPKIVTLICLVIELKVFLQEIIGKDACAILIVTMESLFKFLCWNHHCTLSSYLVSIQFPFHNAVLKILLILSSLVPLPLFCFLLQFSSLPFFRPLQLLVLFSLSSLIYTNFNLTLRKRATSPWILHVSKNSRTADFSSTKNSQNNRSLHNYMILTKLNNSLFLKYITQKLQLKKLTITISILTMTRNPS